MSLDDTKSNRVVSAELVSRLLDNISYEDLTKPSLYAADIFGMAYANKLVILFMTNSNLLRFRGAATNEFLARDELTIHIGKTGKLTKVLEYSRSLSNYTEKIEYSRSLTGIKDAIATLQQAYQNLAEVISSSVRVKLNQKSLTPSTWEYVSDNKYEIFQIKEGLNSRGIVIDLKQEIK